MPCKGYKQTLAHRAKISAALRNAGIHPPNSEATQFRSGEHPWNYTGEPYKLANGYIGIGRGGRGGWRYEHTTIAEKVLGRLLDREKGEMVHHINMDKADNRHCNLLICDQKYHRRIHHAMELAWVKEHCTAGG